MLARLNYRFIALLFVALALFAAIVHGIHTVQLSRHTASFLREARRVRSEGRMLDALAHYRRYTLVAPNDVAALTEFGYLLRDAGSPDQAYLILSRSFQIDPNQDGLCLALVDLAIALQRFADARDYLANVLIPASPDDPELLGKLAVCQAGLGEFRQACDNLEHAIKGDPSNIGLYLRLANLQNSSLNSYGDAKVTLDEMVANNVRDPLAYVARGHWVMSAVSGNAVDGQGRTGGGALQTLESHRYAEVQSDLNEALQLAPASVDANLLGAELALTQMDLDKAVEFATRAKRIAANEPYPVRLLVRVASLKGDHNKAIEVAREGLKNWPNDFQLQWMLANLLIDGQKIDDALPVIEHLRVLSPDPSLIALLEARVLAVEGKWRESAKLVEQNRARLMNWPAIASRADFHLGRCYQQLARPDQELNAYRRALAVDPNSRDLRLAVANALRNSNKFDEAFEEYRAIVEGGSQGAEDEKKGVPLEAVVNYFRLLVREESLKTNGKSLERVVDAMDRLEERNPGIMYLPILRAELYVAQGDLEKASKLIHDARGNNPELFDFFSAEVMLACQKEDWDAVDRLLAEGKETFDKDPRFWMLSGKSAVLRYGIESGDTIRDIAKDESLKSSKSYSDVLSYLASLAFWIQDAELTKELGQQVIAAEPNQLAIRLLLLESAFREKNLADVAPLLAEVEVIDGRHATWNYGEAMRLVLEVQAADGKDEDRKVLKAFAHLADAQKLRPGWGRAITFEAQLLELQGQEDMALSKYLDAISLGERDPKALQRATFLLFQRGRYAEVDRLLGQLNENGSSLSTELLHTGAEAAIQMGKLGRALQLAQDFAETSERSEDHVWLAQLLVMLDRHDEAEAEMKKASELAPSQPGPWLGMVGIYARRNQRELAIKAMEDGSKELEDSQKDLFLGQCYEILGERGKAEASYLAATQNQPDSIQAQVSLVNFYLRNSRRVEARRELQVLLERDEIETDMACWARRNLAIQLATEPNEENTKLALDLLDENEKEVGKIKGDQIARASILASLPSEASRLEAIKVLEAVGIGNLSLDEQFLLAKLYARHGQLQKATHLLRQLAIRSSADPKYLRTYVAALIQVGEESEAILWLDKLREASPNHFTTVDLESRVLFARQRYEQIPSLLNSWLNLEASAEEKGISGRTVQLEWVLSRLEGFAAELKKEEKASVAESFEIEALGLRDGLDEPQMKLERAIGLAARGNMPASVTLLKDLPGKVPARDLGRAVSYLVALGPDGDLLKDIEQLLTAAKQEYASDKAISSVMADVLLMEGKFMDAQEIYLKIIEEDPADVHALNNCALAMVYAGVKSEEAIHLASEAIASKGELPPLLDTRGMAYLAAGKNELAIQDFQTAIANSPQPEYYFHLALAQKAAGMMKESNASFDVIRYRKFNELQLHPTERGAYEELSAVE
ncbi:hypothetical protein DTL42_15370 [Bremerella cremea]|uniref:Tetratricopeptide repeat protein n=1 Tax=Bremerella cremea TaxID=1031537 RepID=A0A368KST8_9BACT|nr:tetratricopeptide repeat protein [Bremerella cremea]RCS46346.1 hypothetical protein DTL42_15370 [Bremerella cremea]